jgi:hypothetical protein
MRKAVRTSTMIALRARREALNIAREIAYPHVEVPPEEVHPFEGPPGRVPGYEAFDRPRRPAWYELRPFFYVTDVDRPAPWWIWWLMAGCLASVAVAAVLIFQSI